MSGLALVGLIILYSVALVTDIRHRKIKNWLTLPGMLIGLVSCVYSFGIKESLIFFGILLVLCLVSESFRLWVSGDSKLIIAGGLFTSLFLGSANLFIALGLFLTMLTLHLLMGHFYWLKKYDFNFKLYFHSVLLTLLNRSENQELGRAPGAVNFTIGNILFISMILFL